MKIEVVIDYPTLRNLSTVPNYLNLLFSGGNIIEEQNKEMQQKFSLLERVHELPKIHKNFDTLPR